ncbi:hypothetical protein EVAR_14964_1 [Eumeta japonica]|uniref:Uncharacterized protein n=1 Tax=Eumeta variegata TaxID=151549 RepID=A0A4C1XMV0_EUMVA|nr:hypothetical protein EVAR_14964_1 [Eumeta japonica]
MPTIVSGYEKSFYRRIGKLEFLPLLTQELTYLPRLTVFTARSHSTLPKSLFIAFSRDKRVDELLENGWSPPPMDPRNPKEVISALPASQVAKSPQQTFFYSSHYIFHQSTPLSYITTSIRDIRHILHRDRTSTAPILLSFFFSYTQLSLPYSSVRLTTHYSLSCLTLYEYSMHHFQFANKNLHMGKVIFVALTLQTCLRSEKLPHEYRKEIPIGIHAKAWVL